MELKQRPEKSVVDFDQKMIQGPNTRCGKTSGEKRWKGKDLGYKSQSFHMFLNSNVKV